MTQERYADLMRNDDRRLTPEEIAEGWHFCVEWDGLLVGPGMSELECCSCWDKTHPVYQTIPPQEDQDFPETGPDDTVLF